MNRNSIEATLRSLCESLPERSTLCVAFSGGLDSAVLLHALAHQQCAVKIRAHHVHHGLSRNADDWATHCQTACDELGVALTITQVDVDRNAPQGIEAAAREARYHALMNDSAADGAFVVTAHHALDQAETLLLQLLRGSGPAGLAAMPARSHQLLRPLLKVPKAEIVSYAARHEVTHIEDESNDDPHFARNRLRIEVWPALSKAFPSAESSLSRAAELQAEAAELAHALATRDARSAIDPSTSALALPRWRSLSTARRRNLLRHWLSLNASPALAFERLHEWERQLLSHHDTQNIVLRPARAAASVRVFRDAAFWVPDAVAEPPAASRQAIDWQGETVMSFAGGWLSFATPDVAATDANARASRWLRKPAPNERWLIRARQPGDAIALSKQSGRVSFKNLMQQAGVAPWLREQWPVLTCNGVVACLPGVCVAGDFVAADHQTALQPLWKPQ